MSTPAEQLQPVVEGIVRGLAQSTGVQLEAAKVAELAAAWLEDLVAVLDSKAKEHAAAAGDAAAAAVTTEDQAEAAQRKP